MVVPAGCGGRTGRVPQLHELLDHDLELPPGRRRPPRRRSEAGSSQDPAERYEVGTATQEGAKYLVPVYPVMAGKRSQEPAVIADVEQEDGQWRFGRRAAPTDIG